MDAGPPAPEMIRALQRHERALAAMYETFARLLPDMADFWRRIASEERAHAEVIEALGRKLPSGTVHVDRSKFTFAGIQTAIGFVNGRTSRFAAEGVSRDAALAAAIDAEHGVLECGSFGIFRSTEPKLLAEFEELASHTKEHILRLKHEREKSTR